MIMKAQDQGGARMLLVKFADWREGGIVLVDQ